LGRLFTQAALFFEKRYFLSAAILCAAIPRHAFWREPSTCNCTSW
jgi:hypothetical protein